MQFAEAIVKNKSTMLGTSRRDVARYRKEVAG